MPNFIEIGGVTRKPLVDLTRNDPWGKGRWEGGSKEGWGKERRHKRRVGEGRAVGREGGRVI